MLSHYHTEIDPRDENSSHASVLRMVGYNKRVLEAGCASGHVSEMLFAQGCKVVGVEIDPTVALSAEQWTERVIIGDFDEGVLWKELDEEYFDVIIFGDVLEHLKDPLTTLRESTRHLHPSGMVVISVPNITHADVKIALLNGIFPYSESGLLDRTHVHFFTKDSLLEMLQEAGLAVTEISRVTVPVFCTEVGVTKSDVDDDVLSVILEERESETYQFVVKAVRDDGSRSLDSLSERLVELTDRLRDEQRRYAELRGWYEPLQAEHQALLAAHQAQLKDLGRLRRERDAVKRLVPAPLLRFVRMLVGPR